jgi:ornithine carbamoyltransferase
MRHFLDLLDLSENEIAHLLKETARVKKAFLRGQRQPKLLGRVLGMVFEKPSLRTRASFQAAIAQLGGTSLFMTGHEAGMGTRESVPDFARVMSQYVDVVVLRTFSHATVEQFAAHSACPVINGLSDYYHPCQALADLFTMQETFGDLKDRTLAFVGDGNNVARSLAICCGKLSVNFILAAPTGYGFDDQFLRAYAERLPQAKMLQNGSPDHAVGRADIIYTDVWTSMGQETERKHRLKSFAHYQVNEDLVAAAPSHARVMHCLPAHRGEEITDDVLDGGRSIVFQQAGNRLHAQKALLLWLLSAQADAPHPNLRKPKTKRTRQR